MKFPVIESTIVAIIICLAYGAVLFATYMTRISVEEYRARKIKAEIEMIEKAIKQ